MLEPEVNTTKILEQSFRKLIIERCRFCNFDQYLEENPDFEFPKIAQASHTQHFISIPGLFGGFAYYLENTEAGPILYIEQSSRMDHSSDDYVYFAITVDGSKILEDEERAKVQKKFQELTQRDHAKRMQGDHGLTN